MTDLTEFLLARIAEDKSVAEAASHDRRGRWDVPDGCSSRAVEDAEGDAVVYNEGSPSDEQAEHIAHWDPPRMLAECEAKRRIVVLHEREAEFFVDADGSEHNGYQCSICHRGEWPCETVELLALPYADHPDYRQEWRPWTR